MKTQAPPSAYIWWLVSKASGIVAVLLISMSVLMGLAMATRVLGKPTLKRALARLHEHVALASLAAIGLHGVSLLGDHWLKPGLKGIAVPFAMSYRPQFSGLGIIAGYLALLVGPSFYLRRRIGARRWRNLHRLSAAVWMLAVVHTLGSGSDRASPWLQGLVILPGIPIFYLLVLRALQAARPPVTRPARHAPTAETGRPRRALPAHE